MDKKIIKTEHGDIVAINSGEVCITNGQTALDFMMTVHYETGCRSIALNKAAIIEDFFVLSTGVAGDVLQKFVNYRFKLAIIGDFSRYTSKPLKDFMFESNKGSDVFFVSSETEAVERLVRAGA